MRYFMELAGRTALVDTSLELRPTAESIPFLRPVTKADGAAAGRTVLVRPAERLEPMPEGGHWEVNRYYVETPEEKRVYSCALPGHSLRCCRRSPFTAGTGILPSGHRKPWSGW